MRRKDWIKELEPRKLYVLSFGKAADLEEMGRGFKGVLDGMLEWKRPSIILLKGLEKIEVKTNGK